MGIRDLVEFAVANRASDLHLRVGSVPTLRINGDLVAIDGLSPLKPIDVETYFGELASEEERKVFALGHELDFQYSIPNFIRCRVNVLQQRSTLSIAIRIIPFKIPTIDELGLPMILKELALKRSGMILITGATGSGKSSTIAAMVDYLNNNAERNIITIEDPIEYVYRNNRCLIVQRNVGHDTESFESGLVNALRHDPDVIVVGEIREIKTMQVAIRAAQTGHLVLGTMHTIDAAQTIHRIIDMFPEGQQEQIGNELAYTILAVVCQILVPSQGGAGRVPACEIMLTNNAIRNLIRERKIHQLYSQIQVSSREGMQTLNQALADLLKSGLITEEQAHAKTSMLAELKSLQQPPRNE
jgi:twitching motility protein PilT